MKKLLLALSAILIAINGFAQKLPLYLNNDTTKYQYSPLYVLNTPNNPPLISANTDILKAINPNDIKNIDILQGVEAVKKYGERAGYGVVIIKLRTDLNVTVPDTNNLLKRLNAIYNIDINTNKLPVYVDSIYVSHPESEYLETKKIKSVNIETEAASGIKFIDILTIAGRPIITVEPPVNSKKREIIIEIRGTAAL